MNTVQAMKRGRYSSWWLLVTAALLLIAFVSPSLQEIHAQEEPIVGEYNEADYEFANHCERACRAWVCESRENRPCMKICLEHCTEDAPVPFETPPPPKKKAEKVAYDKRYRAVKWVGEYAECMMLLIELEKEIRTQEPSWYERAKAKGYYNTITERKHRDQAIRRPA